MFVSTFPSDEGLPALVPLANRERAHDLEYLSSGEVSIPALTPIVERRPFLVPPRGHEHSDVDETLMSISDSSDDADVSSFQYNSGDDAEANERMRRYTKIYSHSPRAMKMQRSDEEEEEELHSKMEEYERIFSHILPFQSDNSWLPHRHSRTGLIPDVLLKAIALQMDSMIRGGSVAPAEPDLVRAKVLVGGLERVSGGLLERMLRVGSAPGAYEDVSKEDKSVSGCAIC